MAHRRTQLSIQNGHELYAYYLFFVSKTQTFLHNKQRKKTTTQKSIAEKLYSYFILWNKYVGVHLKLAWHLLKRSARRRQRH